MAKPVVASYCVTFLAPEMLHVYRQISGLQGFQPHILTQKRLHEDQFPFPQERLTRLPKSRARSLRRLWNKQIHERPIHVSPRQAMAVYRALRQSEAALMHVYFGHIGLYLLPVLRARWLPTVVSFHGADAGVNLDRPHHRTAMEELFLLADRILVRSEALGAELQAMGCPAERIRLNRTGIPLDEWAWQERPTPADGGWRLFQACRLMEKKGLDLSLQAFAAVRKKYPQARFDIAGEGPLRAALEEQARSLGVDEGVHFHGFLEQDELQQMVTQAHVFLHPSRTSSDGNREGVPNAMLEAMATGLPVVATRHGGIPEAVDHETSGLLVEEDDGPAFTAEVMRVIEDRELRTRLAEGGRAAVEEKFSQQAQTANLEAIYQEVIDGAELPPEWLRVKGMDTLHPRLRDR